MNVKFFKKKQTQANPQSEKFVNGIKTILIANGIESQKIQNECSHKLFTSNIRLIRGIAKGENTDALLKTETDNMKSILSSYGITDITKQEDIILQYFALLGDVAGYNYDGN